MDFPIWFSHENQDVQLPTSDSQRDVVRPEKMRKNVFQDVIEDHFLHISRIP